MSTRSNRFALRLANVEDSSQILEVIESGSFTGDISVLFTRRRDPVASLLLEGDSVLILVMVDQDNGKICGVGCCAIRKAFINGQKKRVGYLLGLKVHSDYQRLVPHMSKAYELLHKETFPQVDFYYTTILKENISAKKLLEKKRKGMPEYQAISEYIVYCFRQGAKTIIPGTSFEKGNSLGLKEFYDKELNRYHLAPDDIYLSGLKDSDFYTLRDNQGNIIAACALWNQQKTKQYIITRYSNVYKYLKYLPLHWLGYPVLPKENIPANYGSIALLCVKDQDPRIASCLIYQVAQNSKKYDFLMLGLTEKHPLNPVFQNIKHIKYQSTLYAVNWEQPTITLDERPIHLEVGLL